MIGDLVNRLRMYIEGIYPNYYKMHIVWHAADEIERMRDALREVAAVDIQARAKIALGEDNPKAWRHMLEHIAQYDMQKIAIDALMEGKQ